METRVKSSAMSQIPANNSKIGIYPASPNTSFVLSGIGPTTMKRRVQSRNDTRNPSNSSNFHKTKL